MKSILVMVSIIFSFQAANAHSDKYYEKQVRNVVLPTIEADLANPATALGQAAAVLTAKLAVTQGKIQIIQLSSRRSLMKNTPKTEIDSRILMIIPFKGEQTSASIIAQADAYLLLDSEGTVGSGGLILDKNSIATPGN
jgi:hypothetical protein